MHNKKFNKLLSVSEVSKYLCIPLKSVYYLTETGRIKGIKIGKHWKYHITDIENYYEYGTDKNKMPDIALNQAEKGTDRIERRDSPRINCNLQCRYKIGIPSLKEFSSTGTIRNLSVSGIFLHSEPNPCVPPLCTWAGRTQELGESDDLSQIDVGDPINLDFCFVPESGARIGITVSGRVVRKVTDGLGIKFRGIDEKARDSITKYVG